MLFLNKLRPDPPPLSLLPLLHTTVELDGTAVAVRVVGLTAQGRYPVLQERKGLPARHALLAYVVRGVGVGAERLRVPILSCLPRTPPIPNPTPLLETTPTPTPPICLTSLATAVPTTAIGAA